MPRDPSGNYTLPALGNPAVTNTTITIAWWNGTSTDMATAFTDSLSRSGLGGMLVPFKLVDGTAGAPAFSFQNEPTTGFYLAAAGEMDVSVGGTRLSRWTSAGFQESFDNGSTWKDPLYNNHGDQTFTGGLDFTAGKLTIGGTALHVPVVFGASSTSTGAFTTTSTSFTAVTNANITFTSTGGLVQVQLSSDFTSNAASIGSFPTTGTTPPIVTGLVLALSSDGGSTFFNQQTYNGAAVHNIAYNFTQWPVSGYQGWYSPTAGPGKTIGLYVKATGANITATVSYVKLIILQF